MTKATTAELPVGALPANTSLNYQLYADLDLKAVALRVEVTTDVQIVNLIAVDLGKKYYDILFSEDESLT